jgi:ribosome biogenesis GTPase / thiamine phosphate phosphatase
MSISSGRSRRSGDAFEVVLVLIGTRRPYHLIWPACRISCRILPTAPARGYTQVTSKHGPKHKRQRDREWRAGQRDPILYEPRRFRGRDSSVVPKTGDDSTDLFSDIEANATVICPYGALAFVDHEGSELLCRVDDALMAGKTSILAPGDKVLVEGEAENWLVKKVRPRTSHLTRPAVGTAREQVIAANVDLLVAVVAVAQPEPKPGLIDRFLILAERGGIIPLICVNKTDLPPSEPLDLAAYERLGIPIARTSCKTGDGLGALEQHLRGKLSVFAGHSGVGKSSLINALDPTLRIATGQVSDSTEKGRHTTTASRLHHLDGHTRIIDTPGLREVGLWQIGPQEVAQYFPEIDEIAQACRFRDCSHEHEPGCAVREAVKEGRIPALRFQSYLRIRKSLEK